MPARPRDRHPAECAPLTTDIRHHLRQVFGSDVPDYEVDVTLSPS
ncbi:hypothetical protein [Streptosporangium amethystogenes]|nr:hypothetical protein [Streptosporangium amethystogenes]